MLNLDLKTIIEKCEGKLLLPESLKSDDIMNLKPEGIVHDTGAIKKDYIFFAIRGGNNYISKAFENGAMAVICDREPLSIVGPCILVEDSVQALIKLATYYRTTQSAKIVGIIGSVGKTSTRQAVASVLAQKYNITQTYKNFNNNIGLSLEMFRITPETDVAVLEMGISEFGEMRVLSDIAKPDICIFTNIAECHLESLKDRDGVLKAKTECFENMNPDGFVILNGEDDKLDTIKEVNGKEPYRFGLKNQNAYVTNLRLNGVEGSDVTINLNVDGEESIDVHVSVPGVHMVKNALAAALAGKILGLDNDMIATGIEQAGTIEGRSNIIDTGKYIVLDDCYNASPLSMQSSINNLKNIAGNRRTVAIIGDMKELGSNEIELHRAIGKYAADNAIEVIITVGELAGNMYEGALSACICEAQSISHFSSNAELFTRLPMLLMDGDAILVKASHSMKFDEIVEYIRKM